MKILATSDIHNDLNFCAEIVSSAIENKVDVITISGDLTNFGTQKELQLIIKNLNCDKTIVICLGNHDSDGNSRKFKKFLSKYPKIHVLTDEYLEIDGIIFYGSPYTIRFKNWWFMEKEQDLHKHFPKEHCDIMICHQPPSHPDISTCDSAFGDLDIGSTDYTRLIKNSNMKYYITGHVHECGNLS